MNWSPVSVPCVCRQGIPNSKSHRSKKKALNLGKEGNRNWKSPETWSFQKTGTENPQKLINTVKKVWPCRGVGWGTTVGQHKAMISSLPGFSFVLNQKQRLPWVLKVKGLPSVAFRLHIYFTWGIQEPARWEITQTWPWFRRKANKKQLWKDTLPALAMESALKTCSQDRNIKYNDTDLTTES